MQKVLNVVVGEYTIIQILNLATKLRFHQEEPLEYLIVAKGTRTNRWLIRPVSNSSFIRNKNTNLKFITKAKNFGCLKVKI